MRAESWPHRISVPMRRDSRRPALSFSTMWGHARRQPSAGHQGSSHPTRHQIGRHLGLPSLQNWENNFSCLSHPAYGIVMAARYWDSPEDPLFSDFCNNSLTCHFRHTECSQAHPSFSFASHVQTVINSPSVKPLFIYPISSMPSFSYWALTDLVTLDFMWKLKWIMWEIRGRGLSLLTNIYWAPALCQAPFYSSIKMRQNSLRSIYSVGDK